MAIGAKPADSFQSPRLAAVVGMMHDFRYSHLYGMPITNILIVLQFKILSSARPDSAAPWGANHLKRLPWSFLNVTGSYRLYVAALHSR